MVGHANMTRASPPSAGTLPRGFGARGKEPRYHQVWRQSDSHVKTRPVRMSRLAITVLCLACYPWAWLYATTPGKVDEAQRRNASAAQSKSSKNEDAGKNETATKEAVAKLIKVVEDTDQDSVARVD